MSAIHHTKQIKMKIQASSSDCNTKFTVKQSSDSFPPFLCVVSLPDHGCLWVFQQHRCVNTKVKPLYKMYKDRI
jgi:hypothetical protein